MNGERTRIFSRSSWPEAQRISAALRTEAVGGALLLTTAVAALLWANSPWRESYTALREVHIGPAQLGLDLSLAHWAADGLLALFFFVVGVELKSEFVAGDLRDRAKAVVPMVAAGCGVLIPAAVYLLVTTVADGPAQGWAVPTATDIAFAVAVLAVIGSRLPSGLRSFLLTLAVVDDLIAITIIAFFFTDELRLPILALALVPLGAFALLTQRGVRRGWVLVPLAVLTWVLVLHSGVHATIAGVLLGLVVPVHPVRGAVDSSSQVFEQRLRPWSAGLAVPVFAFFAAGVSVVGAGFGTALTDPVTLGVILALVLGKPIGVFGSTYLLARFTRAKVDEDLTWTDVFGVSLLAGIGFTVSLLIGELAFGVGTPAQEHAKLGVLIGSVISALLATVVLRRRNAVYSRLPAQHGRD